VHRPCTRRFRAGRRVENGNIRYYRGKPVEGERMKDKDKTKEELINESNRLHQQIVELNTLEAKHKKAEEALRRSEGRLNIIFDFVPAMIWNKNKGGKYLQVNRAYCQVVGLSKEKVIGKTDYDLYPENIANQYRKYDQKVFDSGEPEIGIVERHLKPSGEFGWSQTDKSLYYDAEGNIVGIIGFAIDITERKKVEEELRFQGEIMKNLAEGVYLIGLEDGRIIYANPKFEKMFGYKPGEMNGKHVPIVNAPTEKYPQEMAREIMEVLKKTGECHGEINNIKKDGTSFWCYANVSVFDHPIHGKVIISVHTDITERKKAEEEKDTLLKAIETAKEAINIADVDMKMIYTNDAMDKLFGYKKGELIGKFPSILNADPNPEAVTKQIMDAIERDGVWEGEIHNKRKDDTEFISYARISTVKDKYGRIINFVSTQHDITERKKAEEKLKESEKKYRSLVTNIPDVTWTTDCEGNTTFVSPNIKKVYGYNPEEIYKEGERLLLGRIHPNDVEKVKEVYKTLFEKGIPFDSEYRIKRKDGEWIWLYDRSIVTYERDGVMYADGVFSDITERKKAEQKLTDAYQKLKETQEELIQSGKMAAMGQLASGISHELNQPLTGIKGFAQTILMDIEEDNPIRKDVEKIIEQTDRMDRIIKNIRFFARRSEFKLEELDINQPIEDSLMLLKEQLRIHNIHLKKSLGEGLPKIKGDPNQLQQVFLNMITNARGAIDSLKDTNGGELIIKTALSKNKKNIEIIFQDTGCGISKKNIDHIFNPFFTTKSPDGGIGLGLSIAYRIIENRKGKIEVKSKEGKGATFRITLPIL